jgi:phenylacetate-coenzyme A ligase PaaK-like adenylate-forming protein
MQDRLRQSDALHERVKAYVSAPEHSGDSFSSLALDIARYQIESVPVMARKWNRSGAAALQDVADIPTIPVEAFRLTRVAAHAPECDAVCFRTSGTTSGARGQHCMRRTDSYRTAALDWGRRALLPSDANGATVICLAQRPVGPLESSLTFMMQAFLEEWDIERSNATLEQRWLLNEAGVDLIGLRRQLDLAITRPAPVLILATSLALVYLLDALRGERLETLGRAIVMQTGGFKTMKREISAEALRSAVAETFGIDESAVVSEYGMTELSSQLYEGTLARATLRGPKGVFLPPPWMRVEAVDPIGLRPLPDGEPGLARFTDLANVDSAVRILTADRVICRAGAVELIGRDANAVARGCSLTVEELVGEL